MKNTPEGFTFQEAKNGLVTIWHQGRQAAQLRGNLTKKFLMFSERASENERQHRMARLTGNDKHDNEP
ncbi:MAG: hypothetical protein JJ921_14305 [Pseudomonadales bacterium]|nr:hypothetical protein [Pseudomonadales bacterium]MBO7004614.1 hypothetical protein [Pseudomonadales bacterium]